MPKIMPLRYTAADLALLTEAEREGLLELAEEPDCDVPVELEPAPPTRLRRPVYLCIGWQTLPGSGDWVWAILIEWGRVPSGPEPTTGSGYRHGWHWTVVTDESWRRFLRRVRFWRRAS